MSRTVSATFLGAIQAQETDEAFIVLLTIDHDDFVSPIRVSSDGVDTDSGGDTFIAFPFDISLPSDKDGETPKLLLVIDNVSREITAALRTITSPPTIIMEIVLQSDPDTIEATFLDFTMRNVDYNVLTVSGQLNLEALEIEPYPKDRFVQSKFPGLF